MGLKGTFLKPYWEKYRASPEVKWIALDDLAKVVEEVLKGK